MKVEISLWQLCFIWTKAKRNRQITYLHKSTNRWLLAPSEMMFLMTSNSCLGTTYLMSSSEIDRNPDKINIDTCINSHLHKFTVVHFSINSRFCFIGEELGKYSLEKHRVSSKGLLRSTSYLFAVMKEQFLNYCLS